MTKEIISVEMCSDAFFLKHALIVGMAMHYERRVSYWVSGMNPFIKAFGSFRHILTFSIKFMPTRLFRSHCRVTMTKAISKRNTNHESDRN